MTAASCQKDWVQNILIWLSGRAVKPQLQIVLIRLFAGLTYILLHDWAGNMGKYSVRGWQYWPDRREGQYIT